MKKQFNASLTKFNLCLILGFSILLLFVNSCRKDHGPSDEVADNPSIQKISSWYKSNLKLSDENPFSKLRPQWKDVHIAQQANLKVYEILLSNPERLFVASGHIDRSALGSEEEKHDIRLLIFENALTGKIRYGCYMSVEAADGNIPERLHYKNVGELNGTVLFYNFNGTLANGWTYVEGKLANQLTAISKAAYDAQKQGQATGARGKVMSSGYQCVSGWADKYKWGCVTAGNGSPSCGWINVGQEYVTNCNEEPIDHRDDPDEEGAGSGGYIPPVFYDCNDMRDGHAEWNEDCNTCMGGNTGITECPPVDTLNKIKNPCINAGYLKALNKNAKSKIKTLMTSTFLNSNLVNLEFSSMPFSLTGPNANADAYTAPWNGVAHTSQQIVFNENLLPKKSQEYIVATVYHEVLHAYLGNILAKDTNGKLIITIDHENMVFNYLNMLIADLKALYPNMNDVEAWALSWGGLERTTRYELLSTGQKNTIKDINLQYSTKPTVNNSDNSKGSYCQ